MHLSIYFARSSDLIMKIAVREFKLNTFAQNLQDGELI